MRPLTTNPVVGQEQPRTRHEKTPLTPLTLREAHSFCEFGSSGQAQRRNPNFGRNCAVPCRTNTGLFSIEARDGPHLPGDAMKKLRMDLDSLAVTSFETMTA